MNTTNERTVQSGTQIRQDGEFAVFTYRLDGGDVKVAEVGGKTVVVPAKPVVYTIPQRPAVSA